MASALYGLGRRAFLGGEIDWVGDDIRICLVDLTDYTLVIDSDNDLADLAGGGIEETSANLATKTEVDGIADADPVTFTAAAGDACDYVVGYLETGTASTSLLIFNIDDATGLPVTLNGGDVTVTWESAGDYIFKL